MVEIDIVYQGKLRCQSTHEPSGATLLTDAPKDNHGEGAAFSPTDLLATALGTCMMTIMGLVAQRESIDLTGCTVRVIKEMTSSPPRRIAKLTVDFVVKTPLSEVQQQKLHNAAMTCPVHKSLHPDVEVAVTFNWAACDAVPATSGA
jgi:putative redox protein